jgi:hypothetical protein
MASRAYTMASTGHRSRGASFFLRSLNRLLALTDEWFEDRRWRSVIFDIVAQVAEIADSAGIEPRGDKFVIYLAHNGVKHELEITENDILIFSRLIPSFLRRIVGRWNLKDGIVATAAIPVTTATVNDDLHGTEVILGIQDVAGGDFDFWLSADQARKLGVALLARADKIGQSAPSAH